MAAGDSAAELRQVSLQPLASHTVVDETFVALTLLSDLGAPIPHDFVLDFQVDGFDVSPGAGSICVIIDNNIAVQYYGNRVEVRGVPAGHHFLRAVLMDGATGTCLKSAVAMVEAEFYVVSATGPVVHPRPFLFGLPCITHISPRGEVAASSLSTAHTVLSASEDAEGGTDTTTEQGLLVDFFVTNCEMTMEPHGFSVKVYLNGEPVGTLRTWTAFVIVNAAQVVSGPGDTLTLRLALLNPAGEEVVLPAYSNAEYTLQVLSEEEAAKVTAKGPGLSVQG